MLLNMLEDVTKSTLSALLLMSKNKKGGINEAEFVTQSNMTGAAESRDKGYAEKIMYDNPDYKSVNHYRLTRKGINYLKKILEFADKEFK
jgi:hypothetical protein